MFGYSCNTMSTSEGVLSRGMGRRRRGEGLTWVETSIDA